MAVCDKVYKAVDFDVIVIFRHPNSYNSCSPANPSVVVLTYTVGHLQAMFKKKENQKHIQRLRRAQYIALQT